MLNYPSDGQQRVVGNHLAVFARGTGPSEHCVPRFEADFVAAEAPVEMTSGEEAVVFFELTNLGNKTWDLDLTRVGTQDPQDRESVFFKEGNWITPARTTGADHSTYAPGMVGRFTWVMLAPEVTESTRFVETFQLVQEGVTWFGPRMTMDIVVHPVTGPTDPDPDPTDPDPTDPDPADPDPADPGDDDPASGGCSSSPGQGGGLGLLVAAALVFARRRRRYTRTRRTS